MRQLGQDEEAEEGGAAGDQGQAPDAEAPHELRTEQPGGEADHTLGRDHQPADQG